MAGLTGNTRMKLVVLRAAIGVGAVLLGACADTTEPAETRSSIRVVSGAGVADTIMSEVPDPLVVEVRGPDGNLTPNLPVLFISGHDTTVAPLVYIRSSPPAAYGATVETVTDGSGRASVQLYTGFSAGQTEIRAIVQNLGLETRASATVRPGHAAGIAIRPRDSLLFVDRSYRLQANLVDRLGNAIESQATFGTESPQIQLAADGTVQAKAIGRARVGVHIGTFTDSASVAVVPDGVIALYSYGRAVGDPTGFAQMHLDGSAFRWIARVGVAGSGYSPMNPVSRWIPGTRELIYTRAVGQWPRLFIGDSTEAARRLISEAYPVIWETDPEISPDGIWVYFAARDSVASEAIWRARLSDGIPERITTDGEGRFFRWPSLSPDGTQLAYVASDFDWEPRRMYVRDLGSGQTRLVSPNEAAGSLWSPTGEWILYTLSGASGGHSGALRLVRPDGSDDHQLVNGVAYLPGGSWSPDGKYILMARGNGGGVVPYLELIDVATGIRIPLPYQPGWFGLNWRR